MVVDSVDAHPVSEFHYLHNSLHRFGQKLRQRRGLRTWPRFSRNHFPADSRFRQRAVPGTVRWGFGAENGTAGCVTNFGIQGAAVSSPPFHTANGETCSPQHVGPGQLPTDWGQSVPPSGLCYDFTQLGLRFSLKAAMPSRASSDSRACM